MNGLDVEAVLRDHEWRWVAFQQRPELVCSCGDSLRPPYSSAAPTLDDHRAHVAAVLRVEIETALGDAWDEGHDSCGQRHSCPNPYRPTLAATEGDRQ